MGTQSSKGIARSIDTITFGCKQWSFFCLRIDNQYTFNKNPRDQHGWTPLHFAAQNGHLRVCKLIWSNFSQSNAYSCDPYDNFGNTPFKLATQFGHEEVKTAILEFIRSAQKRKSTEETTDK